MHLTSGILYLYISFATLRPSFIITIKTTVNPIRIPRMFTSLKIIRIAKIEARIVSLRRLKKINTPEGLFFTIRPSTPLAMPLRFERPRMPPIRILIGSLFHSMNAESIDRGRRMITASL
jgi:hypothetical protein